MDGELVPKKEKRCMAPFCNEQACNNGSVFCDIHFDDYLRYREEALAERAESRPRFGRDE